MNSQFKFHCQEDNIEDCISIFKNATLLCKYDLALVVYRDGSAELAEYLITNDRYTDGLQGSIQFNNFSVFLLIAKKAKFDLNYSVNINATGIACAHGNIKVLKYLVKNNYTNQSEIEKDNYFSIRHIILNNHTVLLKYLVRKKMIDIETIRKCKNIGMVITIAARNGHFQILKYLTGMGYGRNGKDQWVMNLALGTNHLDLRKYLRRMVREKYYPKPDCVTMIDMYEFSSNMAKLEKMKIYQLEDFMDIMNIKPEPKMLKSEMILSIRNKYDSLI